MIYGEETKPCHECFPIELMPQNSKVFDAVILCIGQLKREWFVEDKKKVLKPWGVDRQGVYYTLAGNSMLEMFQDVVDCIEELLSNGLIK